MMATVPRTDRYCTINTDRLTYGVPTFIAWLWESVMWPQRGQRTRRHEFLFWKPRLLNTPFVMTTCESAKPLYRLWMMIMTFEGEIVRYHWLGPSIPSLAQVDIQPLSISVSDEVATDRSACAQLLCNALPQKVFIRMPDQKVIVDMRRRGSRMDMGLRYQRE